MARANGGAAPRRSSSATTLPDGTPLSARRTCTSRLPSFAKWRSWRGESSTTPRATACKTLERGYSSSSCRRCCSCTLSDLSTTSSGTQ
eukprot:289075-Chlamydomonas_euryale.AAC.3